MARTFRIMLEIVGLASAVLCCGSLLASAACPATTPSERLRLAAYVAGKYHVPEDAKLRVEREEQIEGTCYHKIVFLGDGALGPYRLALYASPDMRFLSSDILDSYRDPEAEELENARAAMARLPEGEFAARGPASAPVTLVVFSDFQCPYCRRMQTLLAGEPLLKPGNGVRLVFRHWPLPQHDWALRAAEAAACAQLQNEAAFWALHDGLFASQETITAANVGTRVHELAGRIPDLNATEFTACLDRQMSLGAVIRDRDMGARLRVTGTPALFVNGQLVVNGIRTAAELHAILADALAAPSGHSAGEHAASAREASPPLRPRGSQSGTRPAQPGPISTQ